MVKTIDIILFIYAIILPSGASLTELPDKLSYPILSSLAIKIAPQAPSLPPLRRRGFFMSVICAIIILLNSEFYLKVIK